MSNDQTTELTFLLSQNFKNFSLKNFVKDLQENIVNLKKMETTLNDKELASMLLLIEDPR